MGCCHVNKVSFIYWFHTVFKLNSTYINKAVLEKFGAILSPAVHLTMLTITRVSEREGAYRIYAQKGGGGVKLNISDTYTGI